MGFNEDDDMEEEPMVQEGDIEGRDPFREYSVGVTAATLVILGDPHPQICPPENAAIPLESTPQSGRSASPALLEMDRAVRVWVV